VSAQHRPGRHELGQNFLTDPAAIGDVVHLASSGKGPLVEWAAGDGALTKPLSKLGRPMEAVEIDAIRAAQLRRTVGPHVAITEGDILRHAPPAGPFDVVCNIPFHITTPVLRHLLTLPRWHTAILITQWEVARKRAGVGGATQLTAQWWPWFDFSLRRRIPATSFTPRPSVDAGLLTVTRRERALVDDRGEYQRWVREVFTGRGRGLPQILARAGISSSIADDWCRRSGLTSRHLPKHLNAEQWAAAYSMRSRTRSQRGRR
jgi:23S rRNA (adenine-N6)-dimethyltransferase